jgi:hypothetical protein
MAAIAAGLSRRKDTIADSLRRRDASPAAGDRGGLRCRECGLDTIEPSVGRG